MSDKKEVCDLCGLAVEVDGFRLKTKEGDKKFCCEGCKGIFQMLHEDQVLVEPAQNS
jgi:hypothetical protein